MISEEDETTWAPPRGPASPDPNPTDDRERESAAVPASPPVFSTVTPRAGEPPVVGQPWTVTAETAAGVSGLVIEIEGRPHNVMMRPETPSADTPPTWSGTIDDIGTDPLRYRFAWRSSWNGDVTDWQTVTPVAPSRETTAKSD